MCLQGWVSMAVGQNGGGNNLISPSQAYHWVNPNEFKFTLKVLLEIFLAFYDTQAIRESCFDGGKKRLQARLQVCSDSTNFSVFRFHEQISRKFKFELQKERNFILLNFISCWAGCNESSSGYISCLWAQERNSLWANRSLQCPWVLIEGQIIGKSSSHPRKAVPTKISIDLIVHSALKIE